jgi:hypothetical protein
MWGEEVCAISGRFPGGVNAEPGYCELIDARIRLVCSDLLDGKDIIMRRTRAIKQDEC